jgi:epoxyqueuosine reductase
MPAVLSNTLIKHLGRTAGFDLIGIAPAEPLDDFERYAAWLERGFHGAMDFLVRSAQARRDPRSILPQARSVIVCGLSYLTHHPLGATPSRTDGAIVSRHRWGADYHKVVRRRLQRLQRLIEERLGRPIRAHLCVDTAPLLERVLAARAGLGWIGKNNCLIHPVFGSFLFLGELVTDLELAPDAPTGHPPLDRCGRCERCLAACPTQALVGPRLLDARRCIAYLTIEHRGPIDPELAAHVGRRVEGCDICQEVCPWNQRAQRRLATNVRELWPAA